MTGKEMVEWQYRPNDMNLGKLQEMMRDKEVWRAAVHRVERVRHD